MSQYDEYPMLERERYSLYDKCGLPSGAVQTIEGLLSMAGARKVGKGALGSVITKFSSKKMSRVVHLESHTCEQVYAYELEMDPAVLMYYTQIPCRGVTRLQTSGRRHVSTATLDFLVFRKDRVELVECKPVDWLRIRASMGSEWKLEGGRWTHGPYAKWAEEAGIPFSVYASPEDVGIYHQNLSAAYAAWNQADRPMADDICEAACGEIREHPRSIAELSGRITGFGMIHALLLLAKQRAFGAWRTISIEREDLFVLYPDPAQAAVVEERMRDVRGLALASVGAIDDPLLSASAVDIERAKGRLRRVKAILDGSESSTRRMRDLARRVERSSDTNEADLSVCLTRYSKSGNRVRRISTRHIELIEHVISNVWNTGKALRPIDLELIYRDECKAAGISEDGISTLRLERRRTNPLRHALATGGMRGYQAIRPHTDPRRRSLPAVGFGQIVHIDSTSVDMRVLQWQKGENKPVAVRAVFYVAVDSATGMPLGMSMLFGSPRSDGLAILFRDVVRRNGFIPPMLHMDRGPENRSKWLEEFCEGSSVRYSPTAGSAWNSPAEATLKMVNYQVAQRLIGSTAPDQRGRAADGHFKSRKTARLDFLTLYHEMEHYVFEELANRCVGAAASPKELREDLVERGGDFGIPTSLDDDFLIRTSVALGGSRAISPRGALRLEEGTFCSDELLDMHRRMEGIDHVRLDCEDGKLLYVKGKSGCWIKAFHQRFQSLLDPESLVERTFDFCWDSIERPVIRQEKLESSRKHAARINRVNEEAGHAHSQATAADEAPQSSTVVADGERLSATDEISPYDEEDIG